MKKLRFALLIVACGFSAAIALYSSPTVWRSFGPRR